LFSAAILSIIASDNDWPCAKRQTAAGLPANGVALKASTCKGVTVGAISQDLATRGGHVRCGQQGY